MKISVTAPARLEDNVAAYRKAIGLQPGFGEAWWSLANLKTFRFSAAETAVMDEQLRRTDLAVEARLHFQFTLGKALEDAGDYAASFAHYAEGNRLRQMGPAALRRSRHDRPAASLAGAVHAGLLRSPCGRRLPRARPDLHRRPAALGLHAGRADPLEPPVGRGHDGTAGPAGHRARARRPQVAQRRLALSGSARHADGGAAARPGGALPRRDAHPAQDRGSVLHRQDAEQLRARGAHRADPAERAHHRRAPPPDGLLLLQLQAALRARPAVHLRPRRTRPLLPGLRRADGALGQRAAGARAPRILRAAGRGHRGRGPAPARLLRPADGRPFKVGENLATTPGAVVFKNEMLELIQYKPTTEEVYEIPLMVVPSQINKFYANDLSPEKSVVRFMLSQGFQTFAVSWRNPQKEHAHWGLEDYVASLIEASEVIRKITKSKQINVSGACSGGMTTACYLSELAARKSAMVNSFTLQVCVLDGHKEDSEVGLFVTDEAIEAARRHSAKKGILSGEFFKARFHGPRREDIPKDEIHDF